MTSSKYKLSYETWAAALVTMFILVPTVPVLLLAGFEWLGLREILLAELLFMFVCLPLLFVCLTSIRRSLRALAEDTRRIRARFQPSQQPPLAHPRTRRPAPSA